MNTIDLTTWRPSAVGAASVVRASATERSLAAGPGEPPALARLRCELASDDHHVATSAARAFLELLEPDSLPAALACAFDGAGPAQAQAALHVAWQSFRHDRHRGTN